jgi:hypothetical protein
MLPTSMTLYNDIIKEYGPNPNVEELKQIIKRIQDASPEPPSKHRISKSKEEELFRRLKEDQTKKIRETAKTSVDAAAKLFLDDTETPSYHAYRTRYQISVYNPGDEFTEKRFVYSPGMFANAGKINDLTTSSNEDLLPRIDTDYNPTTRSEVTLSEILNFLAQNGAKNVTIFDFSCSVFDFDVFGRGVGSIEREVRALRRGTTKTGKWGGKRKKTKKHKKPRKSRKHKKYRKSKKTII